MRVSAGIVCVLLGLLLSALNYLKPLAVILLLVAIWLVLTGYMGEAEDNDRK